MRCWRGLLILVLLMVAACRSGAEAEAPVLVTDAQNGDGRVRASLEHECVAAGGEQALSVLVEQGVGVRYESTYADGESGRPAPHGGGYGGVGLGVSSEGVVAETWEVSEDAPPGLVVVYVSALLSGSPVTGDPDDSLTRLMLVFWLVGPDQECPADGEVELEAPPEILTDTADEHPEVRATLEHKCVQAAGDQTLTVQAVRDAMFYNSVYANGESGRPRPDGGGIGGAGFGIAQDQTVEETWPVGEDVPLGPVRVLVQALPASEDADGESVRLELVYMIVGSEDECP